MKKTFDCGHKGNGSYCHRCATENARKQADQLSADAVSRAKAEQKARLQARKVDDVLDLSLLDHIPSLQDSAREIIRSVQHKPDFRPFYGKRLAVVNNEITSVKVGDRYRLLFATESAAPLGIYSHESYNTLITSGSIRALAKRAMQHPGLRKS